MSAKMECRQSLEGLSNSFRYTFGALNVVVSIMAVVGNLFIFIAIYKNRSLRTKSNCFLVSLAMTDIFVGAILQPIFVAQLFSPTMAASCFLNNTRRTFTALLTGSSMGTIAAISYDRYVHLSKTIFYHQSMTVIKASILMAICWILPLISTFLKYLGRLESAYSAAIFIYALITISIIVISYVMIIRIIRRKKTEMSKISNDEMPQRNRQRNEEKRALSTETRAAKAIAAVIVVYCTTVLPISIYQGLTSVKVISTTSKNVYVKVFYAIALTISSTNSIVNPFIYYYRIPGFKETVKNAVVPIRVSFGSQEKSSKPNT